jgi:hypothetical protein
MAARGSDGGGRSRHARDESCSDIP